MVNLFRKYCELLKFCIVGTICTGVDALLYYGIKNIVPYQFALISGYCISLLLNYFLTVYWTFKVGHSIQNLLGIVLAHLFNLFIVRMGLMHILVSLLHISDNLAYWPVLSISVLSNFLVIKFIVHKNKV